MDCADLMVSVVVHVTQAGHQACGWTLPRQSCFSNTQGNLETACLRRQLAALILPSKSYNIRCHHYVL